MRRFAIASSGIVGAVVAARAIPTQLSPGCAPSSRPRESPRWRCTREQGVGACDQLLRPALGRARVEAPRREQPEDHPAGCELDQAVDPERHERHRTGCEARAERDRELGDVPPGARPGKPPCSPDEARPFRGRCGRALIRRPAERARDERLEQAPAAFGEAVEDDLALPAAVGDTRLSQRPHVVRDEPVGALDDPREVADAELVVRPRARPRAAARVGSERACASLAGPSAPSSPRCARAPPRPSAGRGRGAHSDRARRSYKHPNGRL